MIKHLEKESDFEKIISEDEKVIVDFYADWCGPCKRLGRTFESFQNDYDDITILKVDVDSFPNIAALFNVVSIPYLVGYINGKRADFVYPDSSKHADILGAMEEDELKLVLDQTF